jgi:hypothetical protein
MISEILQLMYIKFWNRKENKSKYIKLAILSISNLFHLHKYITFGHFYYDISPKMIKLLKCFSIFIMPIYLKKLIFVHICIFNNLPSHHEWIDRSYVFIDVMLMGDGYEYMMYCIIKLLLHLYSMKTIHCLEHYTIFIANKQYKLIYMTIKDINFSFRIKDLRFLRIYSVTLYVFHFQKMCKIHFENVM